MWGKNAIHLEESQKHEILLLDLIIIMLILFYNFVRSQVF